jgi:hypothetical protein
METTPFNTGRVRNSLTTRSSRDGGRAQRSWIAPYLRFRAAAQREAATRDWIKQFMRPAFLLIAIFEFACIGLGSTIFGKPGYESVLRVEVFNAVAGFVVLSLMWTLWFERHWRATAFGFCSVVLVGATLLSLVTGRTEPLFVSVLLLLTGAGSLVPWETRWQTALTGLCLGWLALNALWLPHGTGDPDGLYKWLALLAACGLAHLAAARNEHQRRDFESRSQLFATASALDDTAA